MRYSVNKEVRFLLNIVERASQISDANPENESQTLDKLVDVAPKTKSGALDKRFKVNKDLAEVIREDDSLIAGGAGAKPASAEESKN
mmetsp:Transcript_12709/g.17924  ORF Transcript_12709/g.17924 Transcript_12709/m.17924 type:complete len:87 (+) Transcript_12709:199-459(+)